MTPTQYPKRLIEVDLPIKRISAHARREKSIRHGHISTLHIWWARRPLAACRAVICASLWPDPADPLCPQSFRDTAQAQMRKWVKDHVQLLGPESFEHFVAYQKDEKKLEDDTELRRALLDFIADFANWDNSTKKEYLDTSRALTQSAHEALGGTPGTRPLVVDPFAGGGSIPLEALRVGADAFASDLNPVAVLLNKVVLEYIPKYGQRLADEVRKWGQWIKEQAEKELAEFYPKDPDGATPIAYLWARTITCEGPGCGAQVPLIRSLWLAKRSKKSTALRLVPRPERKQVDFEVVENVKPKDVGEGTVRRGSATCPCCGYTTPAEQVRSQFLGRNGGAADAALAAVALTSHKSSGRLYRTASKQDYHIATSASNRIDSINKSQLKSLTPIEPLPYLRSIFNINLLDVNRWVDLYSPRQLLSILTLCKALDQSKELIQGKAKPGLVEAVVSCLALAIDRQADYNTSLCRWVSSGEFIANTFGRQALGIIWDFAEVNPFGNASGDFDGAYSWVADVCERLSMATMNNGHTAKASATQHPLPDDSCAALITDPPYYDAVPYADLSDFFYAWLKRSIGNIHVDLFKSELTPKELEIVQLAERNKIYAYKTRENFEHLMSSALSEGRRIVGPQGIGVIVFAHKTTQAWETMLQAVVDAGWVIVGSWPIDTERQSRLRAVESAALASSVHLVCRPRENPDGSLKSSDVADWRDVLRALPQRIHDWMPRLAAEGIVGADAIFACLGPALEIYSRYSRVEKASGEQVTLKEYLEQVWAAVAREALNMIFAGADATGFEEDARLTAMWLWTMFAGTAGAVEAAGGDEDDGEGDEGEEGNSKSTKVGGFGLEYDAARKIAQGIGAHLEELSSLVEVKGSKARLLAVAERARALFGKADAGAVGGKAKRKTATQMSMFEIPGAADAGASGSAEASGELLTFEPGTTVLDRVHQSMLLFGANRGPALKRLLVEEGVGRDERFWRLAQALSALYPTGTDEKRWVDGVLARKKGLGF